MVNRLNLQMNRGFTPLMLCLPEILSLMDDHKLHAQFITGLLEARHLYVLPNLEMAIDKVMEYFCLIQDYDEEGEYIYFTCPQPLKCACLQLYS
jgi:hypothetical protein